MPNKNTPHINQHHFKPIFFRSDHGIIGPPEGLTHTEFFVEFHYDTTDLTALETAIMNELAGSNIDTKNLVTTLMKVPDNLDEKSNCINVLIEIANEKTLNQTQIVIARTIIEEINNLVLDGTNVAFNNNGEIVIANLRKKLTTEEEHKHVYHYNQYYQFTDLSGEQMDDRGDTSGIILASNRIFKLLNYTDITKTSAIRSKDHCYFVDLSGLYMKKNVKVNTEFEFTADIKEAQLLEIYGYRQDFLYEISAGNTIPDDYGFKLEVLPPFVEGINNLGLDSDGFSFATDTTWTNIGLNPDEITADIWNYIETGETSEYDHITYDTSDNQPGYYLTYNIDQRWIYYDVSGDIFKFTYDNNHINSEVFYNGSRHNV